MANNILILVFLGHSSQNKTGRHPKMHKLYHPLHPYTTSLKVLQYNPSDRRPVVLKPVSRILEIVKGSLIQEFCRKVESDKHIAHKMQKCDAGALSSECLGIHTGVYTETSTEVLVKVDVIL